MSTDPARFRFDHAPRQTIRGLTQSGTMETIPHVASPSMLPGVMSRRSGPSADSIEVRSLAPGVGRLKDGEEGTMDILVSVRRTGSQMDLGRREAAMPRSMTRGVATAAEGTRRMGRAEPWTRLFSRSPDHGR